MNGLKSLKLSRGLIIAVAIIIIVSTIFGSYIYFISQNRQVTAQKPVSEFVDGIRADVYPTIPIQHPGKIIIKNLGDKSTRELGSGDVPISGKFVFYKDGKEVLYPGEFDEAVPIVEVELIPTDQDGNIILPQSVSAFQTKEYGEGHKLLRSSSGQK